MQMRKRLPRKRKKGRGMSMLKREMTRKGTQRRENMVM